jgi:hypothetical protein
MGFSTLLDILGSTVIGGLLLLILLRMNDSAVENNFLYSGEEIVQQNIVDVVRLIEYDFRKIGYCANYEILPDGAVAIREADSTDITFWTDLPTKEKPYGDEVIDIVRYYLGPTTESTVSSTPNPNDRMLYRVVNNETPKGSNLGVTNFKLTYYDSDGHILTHSDLPTSPPLGIASIQIDVAVENPNAYDAGKNYTYDKRAIWRQIRLATKNFMKR